MTYKILPLSTYLGENGWKISSALAARHIGGAINFVAVCETLNVNEGSIVSAAIAADNVVVALYFAFLFYLAVPGEDQSEMGNGVGRGDDEKKVVVEDSRTDSDEITMQSLSVSIAVSSCLVTAGKILTRALFPGTSVSTSTLANKMRLK